jgi:HEAT repeat protein
MDRIVGSLVFTACLILAAGSVHGQEQEKAERAAKAAAEAKARAEEAKALAAKQQAIAAVRQAQVQKAAAVAALVAPAASPHTASQPSDAGRDEELLRSVGVSADGPGLLAFFHLRSQGEASPERLAALVEQLGDKSPAVALKASGELAAIGAPALPMLRRAVKDPDQQQIMLMAQRCLHALDEHPGQLSAAAARLVSQRRPRGTAAALLEFLPSAEDEGVVEEIRLALLAVAHADGKPDAALLHALRDESPIRRALAIDTLCQNGISAALVEQIPLDTLLQDPKPSVRLRAALTLARAHDARAIAALIALLTELPLDHARQAEDFLSELAGDRAPKMALEGDAAARQKCRDAWAAWWKGSEDSQRLLEELRKRTPTESVRQKCEALVSQLGDTDFAVREKAEAEVRAMGVLIVPLLRQAVRHGDLEVRRRARACLDDMERDKNLPLSPITTRLIALRKPSGAAEALLAFVPYADEDTNLGEVQLALNAVAIKEGKLDPVVVAALAGPQAARRAAAAEALCLGGDREHLPVIHKMLHDPAPSVRLKTALALAGARQRDAVPVLIDLIAQMPGTQAVPAEEYLQRLAADRGPASLPPGADDATRKKRRDAWTDWWKAHGERATLVDRYPPATGEHYHGYTLLVLANNGSVVELGADRKVRWQLNGLLNPRDVQVLGPDRILVAEYNGQRITERNRRGEVLWQKQLPGTWPLAVQRLRNGHTFISCQNKLVEVDRAGREVLAINRPQNDVVVARKMRDGQIILVTTQRFVIRMDAAGKELKNFQVQMVWQHNGVNILPNGHVLVPAQWINRVTEYDAEGKTVFDAAVMQPTAACRLPNGNVLVAPQQWPAKVVELDRSGKQVSDFTTATYVYRIHHR